MIAHRASYTAMRLLSTDRAELHFFASPEDVPGGYAILSHVWDEREDTFQDIEALRVECASSGRNPRDLVSEKIRKSCILAEKHDYKWIWVDTCCIDKSSSAELSEAINSMYRYYAHSAICYAFLRDVRSRHRMNSIWYKRGWTLQELIAPRLLVFVSHKWEVLGTKGDLASKISSQTQIPEEVLRHEMDLAYVSVGQRMSWASRRDTTRVEDRAYSLMGIFGINMPTLYGEGDNAFYRLQEEIMKVSTDPTLFAWGRYNIIKSSLYAYVGDESPGAGSEGTSAPPGGTSALLEGSDSVDALREASHPCKHLMTGKRSLLAPSPSEFAGRYSLTMSGTDEVQVSHAPLAICPSNCDFVGRTLVNHRLRCPLIPNDTSRSTRIPSGRQTQRGVPRPARCATLVRQLSGQLPDRTTSLPMHPHEHYTAKHSSVSRRRTKWQSLSLLQTPRGATQAVLDEVLHLGKTTLPKHRRHPSEIAHIPPTRLCVPIPHCRRCRRRVRRSRTRRSRHDRRGVKHPRRMGRRSPTRGSASLQEGKHWLRLHLGDVRLLPTRWRVEIVARLGHAVGQCAIRTCIYRTP